MVMCAQCACSDLTCARASAATTGAQITSSPRKYRPSGALPAPANDSTLVGLSLCRYCAFKLRLRALPTMRTDSTVGFLNGASAAAAHLANRCELGTQGMRDAQLTSSSSRATLGAVVGRARLIRLDDSLYEWVTHHVARRKHREGDAPHAAQYIDHRAQAGLLGVRQVDL